MRRWDDAPRLMLRGLDLLLCGLAALAVGLAPTGRTWWAFGTAVALVAVYAWGRRRVRVHERPMTERSAAWWPERIWMVALLLVWAAMVAATPSALWIAFPLMLLQMHVLGPAWGTAAVVVTAAATVAFGLARMPDGDPSVGYVIGPLIGALVAIGFVLGLEAIMRESQARQRMLDELEAARALLADAERDRVTARERERLAREIHDTLAQGFSAVELLLRAADPEVGRDDERARELIGQASLAARDNLAEARRFVRALSPPDLAAAALPDALERVAARSRSADLEINVRVAGQARALGIAVETALLRVAQSALANVVQHAGASRTDVTLTFTPEEVLLDVVDDGGGFDPAAAPSGGGYGLRAMRSRAAELGGTVTIETGPGAGTAVAARVPDAVDPPSAAQTEGGRR